MGFNAKGSGCLPIGFLEPYMGMHCRIPDKNEAKQNQERDGWATSKETGVQEQKKP